MLSFSIDKVSDLVFDHLNQSCSPIVGINTEVRGSKLIGIPDVLKFDHTYTSNIEGKISLQNIEWDNYTPAVNSEELMIYGSSPIQQITVLPDTSQTYTLVLGPKTENSFFRFVQLFISTRNIC